MISLCQAQLNHTIFVLQLLVNEAVIGDILLVIMVMMTLKEWTYRDLLYHLLHVIHYSYTPGLTEGIKCPQVD